MPEIQNITFTHREIAEVLVKKQNIHEGIWGIYIEFGIAGANINAGSEDTQNFVPAAIVPVLKIGIQKFPTPSNITVDAAIINPE